MGKHVGGKDRIVEKAYELFGERGYDRTSLNSILRRAGLSKGTFYYHFNSKEEVLDAVTDKLSHLAAIDFRRKMSRDPKPAVARLNEFFSVTRKWRAANSALFGDIMRVVMKDENAAMKSRFEGIVASFAAPMMAEIIQQGKEEDVFDCGDANELAGLVISIVFADGMGITRMALNTEFSEDNLTVLKEKLDIQVESIERIIGAQHGSLERVDTDLLRQIYKSVAKKPGGQFRLAR